MGAVSFEPIAGILRYHPRGGFGDPYIFTCTVLLDNNQATIKGAMGEYSLEVRRSIEKALRSIGVTSVKYERRRSDGSVLRKNVGRDVVHGDVANQEGLHEAKDEQALR